MAARAPALRPPRASATGLRAHLRERRRGVDTRFRHSPLQHVSARVVVNPGLRRARRREKVLAACGAGMNIRRLVPSLEVFVLTLALGLAAAALRRLGVGSVRTVLALVATAGALGIGTAIGPERSAANPVPIAL